MTGTLAPVELHIDGSVGGSPERAGVGPPWVPDDPVVVAFGTFDGVHRGHVAVLDALVSLGRDLGASAVVVAPRRPGPPELGGARVREAAIAERGVDHLLLVADPGEVEARSRSLEPAAVVAGRGSPALGPGYRVHPVDPVVDFDGLPVRSARVHAALVAGDVGAARSSLGRSYALGGLVEGGDRRGRELGFPTANVAVDAQVALPLDGVYAGRYRSSSGTEHVAAISVGRRPTFYDESGLRLVEAHLVDFDGDLYGDEPEVSFDAWVRGQERFEGVEELIAQMRRDVARVPALVADAC